MFEIQSVIFDNSLYNVGMARLWLKRNNIKPMKLPDKTAKYYRFRIEDPVKFKSFITQDVSTGVKVIIGFD
jgi:hypothetical protein